MKLKMSMKWQKRIVFVMVLAAVYGFVTVDAAYSNMLDEEGKILPNVRRINSEYVVVSILGKSTVINTEKIGSNWNELNDAVVDNLDSAVQKIRQTFGMDNEKIKYDSFQVHLL